MEFEIDDQNSIHTLHATFKSLRKISEDMIMNISSENLSFRSVNASKTALPVIKFHPNFFKVFSFNEIREKIVVSVPVSSIIMAFKKALSPTKIKMSIADADTHCLFLTLYDKFGIAHNWEFPISDTSLISAVVDLTETTFQIKCRNDVFNGISEVFRMTSTIILDIINDGKNPHTLNFKSNYQHGDTALSSTLTLYKCDKCDIIYSDDIKHMQISFFLQDYIVGLKLAGFFAQFIYLYIIGPGQPIVIKSSSSNMFEFEMPLATIPSEKDEKDNEMRKFVNSEKNDNFAHTSSNSSSISNFQHNINYSTQSQVTAWQQSINGSPTINDLSSSDNQKKNKKNSRSNTNNKIINNFSPSSTTPNRESLFVDINSQKNSNSGKAINELFEASPPFPFKRKIISQKVVVQASQPFTDDEEI